MMRTTRVRDLLRRDMPLEFGKWETAYKRYRLWNDTGLWLRLLVLLGDASIAESAEVTL